MYARPSTLSNYSATNPTPPLPRWFHRRSQQLHQNQTSAKQNFNLWGTARAQGRPAGLCLAIPLPLSRSLAPAPRCPASGAHGPSPLSPHCPGFESHQSPPDLKRTGSAVTRGTTIVKLSEIYPRRKAKFERGESYRAIHNDASWCSKKGNGIAYCRS